VNFSKEMKYPRIVERSEILANRWMRVLAKHIQLHDSKYAETYYSVEQADYVTVLAQTTDEQIPIVRQYRHAVESYTWELPSGLVEVGEIPEEACRRELKEEAGLDAIGVTLLGSYFADCGRLANKIHIFHAQASEVKEDFVPETGMEIRFVSLCELRQMARSHELMNSSVLATLMLYEWWARGTEAMDRNLQLLMREGSI